MARISVAMATYNGGKYLREQLESLYSQTRVPDEIVVCDDCSRDNTIDILEEFHQKKGLKYFVNSTNLGVNKNFEKAIRLCAFEYVAICDQDDVWFSKKIEILLNKIIDAEKNQPCVVSSRCVELAEKNRESVYRCGADSSGASATLLGPSFLVQGCTLIMNRKMIDLLRPFPHSYQDVMMYDGYISFVAASCGVKYNLAQVLMGYRRHDSNVMGGKKQPIALFQRVVNKIKYMKYDRMFPSSRCFTLKYVYDEYCDIMHDDAKDIIKKIIAYGNSGLFNRLKIISSINDFGICYKIKQLLFEFFMYFVPINK